MLISYHIFFFFLFFFFSTKKKNVLIDYRRGLKGEWIIEFDVEKLKKLKCIDARCQQREPIEAYPRSKI